MAYSVLTLSLHPQRCPIGLQRKAETSQGVLELHTIAVAFGWRKMCRVNEKRQIVSVCRFSRIHSSSFLRAFF